MDDLSKRHFVDLIVDMLLASLRLENTQLNALATELCGRLGGRIARRLVLHAASRQNALKYRLRLLGALGRVEDGFDPDSVCDLSILSLRDRSPQIRAAADAALRGLPRPEDGKGM